METIKLESILGRVEAKKESLERDIERHRQAGKDKLVSLCENALKKVNELERVGSRIEKTGVGISPISHGGEFEAKAIWDGALLIVQKAPDSYCIDLHNAIVGLGGVKYKW